MTTTYLYNVTYHVEGSSYRHSCVVRVTDGYSTTDDIPQIIAIRRFHGATSAAHLIVVDDLELVSSVVVEA